MQKENINGECLSNLAHQYELYLQVSRGVRPSTLRRHGVFFRKICSYIDTVDNFTLSKIQEFIALLYAEKYAQNTISVFVFALRTLADFLVIHGYIETNFVASTIKIPPKELKPVRTLTAPEIKMIIDAPMVYKKNQHMVCAKTFETYRLLHYLLAYTGGRVGEIVHLKVEDLDFENRVIHFTKTKTVPRVVPMAPDLVDMLHKHVALKSEEQYVLETSRGKRIHPGKVPEDMKKRAKLVGIEKRVYSHLYRHSFASLLHKEGAPILHISKLLGHSRVETTIRYIHSIIDELAETLETFHPLIRSNRSAQDWLLVAHKSIERTGATRSPTCRLVVKENEEYIGLSLKIKK